MPNNWLAVDSNLPDLSRVTNPKEQIAMLFDYMVVLTEQLRFSLQNLSVSNWNTTALNELKNSVSDDALKAVEQLRSQLNRMATTVGGHTSRIVAVENKISGLELSQEETDESIHQLEEDTGGHEVRIIDLETLLNAEGGIIEQLSAVHAQVDEIQQQVNAIGDAIKQTETGLEIGKEGTDLKLVGNVYINGVLIEQEGATG